MNNDKNKNKNKKSGPQVSLTWIYMIIAITLGYLLMNGDSTLLSGGSSRNATYSQFKSYVEQGYASRIIVNKN
jgi:cell division protease FtsH